MLTSGLDRQLHEQHVCTHIHIDKVEGAAERRTRGHRPWVDSIGAPCPGQPGTVVSLCLPRSQH